MKRLLSLVLMCCFFLPLCAGAETIKDQVASPDTIQTTFSSNTGKTVITIDAVVHMPEVEEVFLIPVTSVAFDDELVSILAELTWPGLGSEKLQIEEDDIAVEANGQTKRGYKKHSVSIVQSGTEQLDADIMVSTFFKMAPDSETPYAASLQSHIEYGINSRRSDLVNYSGLTNPGLRDGIEGHPFTANDALNIANTFLHGITNEPFELFEMGAAQGYFYGKDPLEGSEFKENDFSYSLIFTRNVNGIPLLYGGPGNAMSTVARDDLYIPPVGYENISMILNREGRITKFNWSHPYEIATELRSVTLLPFETIMSVAQTVMPLKYQIWERENEVHKHVNRIDFGYMAVLQQDSLCFALTPVWTFYGYDEQLEPSGGISPLLTINAENGTVIDLEYGY